MSMTQTVKRLLLPRGERPRRLPSGIGRGLTMNVDFDRGQTRMFVGLYEVELNKHLRRLCRPGFRSFDIGGNVGYDALVIAKLSHGPVVSVECEPDLAAEIRGNVALNPDLASLVEVEVGFVGDGEGQLSIDALADRHFVPDFIKLDIEGAEAGALRTAARVLAERKPNLLIETHGREVEDECLEILAGHGYQPETVDPRRWLADRRLIEHNRWLVAEG